MGVEIVNPVFSNIPVTLDDFYTSGESLIARLANSPRTLKDAWAIRHAAYASHGYIDPREDRLFSDPCDHLPTTKVVVLYRRGAPVATVRLCLYAPDREDNAAAPLPAMEVFGNEIADLMIPGGATSRRPRIVEIMCLATDPKAAGQSDLAFALFLAAGCIIWSLQANGVVCAVRRHHIPIYRRLGFQQITDARPYPKLKFETALMARMAPDAEALRRAMPILPISPDDDVYEDFVGGLPVPLFSGMRSPEHVRRALGHAARAGAMQTGAETAGIVPPPPRRGRLLPPTPSRRHDAMA